jgi:hypothetical protein
MDSSGSAADYSEHGNEPSVSAKDGEFLDQLIDYKLLDDSIPWSLFYYSLKSAPVPKHHITE